MAAKSSQLHHLNRLHHNLLPTQVIIPFYISIKRIENANIHVIFYINNTLAPFVVKSYYKFII